MPVSSKSLSSLSSSGSSSSPFSSTWLASLSPNTRKAVYTVLLGGLISALVVPSLLPTRVSFFGIPPVRDVFAHLSTGHAHKAALKRKGLEAWMESERSYAWDRLLEWVLFPLAWRPNACVHLNRSTSLSAISAVLEQTQAV